MILIQFLIRHEQSPKSLFRVPLLRADFFQGFLYIEKLAHSAGNNNLDASIYAFPTRLVIAFMWQIVCQTFKLLLHDTLGADGNLKGLIPPNADPSH